MFDLEGSGHDSDNPSVVEDQLEKELRACESISDVPI
jgi:hypothetical protein